MTNSPATRGQGVVYLVEGSRTLTAFAVSDAVRPESAEVVLSLLAPDVIILDERRP